jgi:hypothetical protein
LFFVDGVGDASGRKIDGREGGSGLKIFCVLVTAQNCICIAFDGCVKKID